MTVKSLSQMMKPGVVGANGDCDTCGPGGSTPVVTRVATQNLAKLNKAAAKPAQAPAPIGRPIQEAAKALAVAVNASDEEEEQKKNKGGRPRLEPVNPNLPRMENPPAPPEKKPSPLSANKKEGENG